MDAPDPSRGMVRVLIEELEEARPRAEESSAAVLDSEDAGQDLFATRFFLPCSSMEGRQARRTT